MRLLVADGDAEMRRLLAAYALETLEAVEILEAENGAEAVQLGFQQRPQIALLDLNMPKLGGIEVALALRALQPEMRLALQTGDTHTHRDRARAHRLPLFDKLELDGALRWLERQVQSCAVGELQRGLPQRCALECSSCGYGIVCPAPPARCPMCQAEDAWIHAPWRPFRGQVGLVV